MALKMRDVSVIRCDANGTADDGGAYFKISATIIKGAYPYGVYCIYTETDYYTERFIHILDTGDHILENRLETDTLGGDLDANKSYRVYLTAEEDARDSATTSVLLPAQAVFVHKDGEKNSISFGERVTERDTISVSANMSLKVKKTPEKDTDAANKAYVDRIAIEDATYPGCFYRIVFSDKEAGDLEWLNPPMLDGVEYRTTERHNGKVVYVTHGNLGEIIGGDMGNIELPEGITDVIRLNAIAKSGVGNTYLTAPDGFTVRISNGYFDIAVDDYGEVHDLKVQLWYTKD